MIQCAGMDIDVIIALRTTYLALGGEEPITKDSVRKLFHGMPRPEINLNPGGINFVERSPELQLQDLQRRFDDQIHQTSELAELLEQAIEVIMSGGLGAFTLGVDVAEYKRRYEL